VDEKRREVNKGKRRTMRRSRYALWEVLAGIVIRTIESDTE
jgi:hypothetical protein